MVGSCLGFVWALISTSRRRRLYLRAAIPPIGQLRWFMLSLVSMSCYLTLVTALGLASHIGLLPQALFWYLLGLSVAAFATALMFPGQDRRPQTTSLLESRDPPADPPIVPVRRSA